MPRFRATVWVLTSAADVVDGDAGINRYITEKDAEDARDFEADIRDQYIHDVDTMVWFGPISEVKR